MAYADDLQQQQEAQRLTLEEQMRQQEEQRKRDEEKRRQQLAAMQPQQPASPAAQGIGGIDPSQMMSIGSSMMGSSPAASGIGAGGAEAGAGGAGAGGAGSAAGSGFSAWPIAVAALAIGQHEWAKNKGLHTDADALTGRALYKDGEYYQQKGNEKVGGMGDEMRLASLGSSPADLFRKETWTEGAKLAARGGILGNLLKKIF